MIFSKSLQRQVTKPVTNKLCEFRQVIFFGPLYSLVNKYRKKIKLRLHLSGEVFIPIPYGIIAKMFKKRLVLFGEKHRIHNFMNGIIKLRKNDIYTGTGLRTRTGGYIKKKGKVRRR